MSSNGFDHPTGDCISPKAGQWMNPTLVKKISASPPFPEIPLMTIGILSYLQILTRFIP